MAAVTIERQMKQFEIFATKEGDVTIARDIGMNEKITNQVIISIHPIQVDGLIQTLLDVKADAEAAGPAPDIQMNEVRVYGGSDGLIHLARNCDFPEYEHEHSNAVIALHPLQINPLITWLTEVKEELSKKAD